MNNKWNNETTGMIWAGIIGTITLAVLLAMLTVWIGVSIIEALGVHPDCPTAAC